MRNSETVMSELAPVWLPDSSLVICDHIPPYLRNILALRSLRGKRKKAAIAARNCEKGGSGGRGDWSAVVEERSIRRSSQGEATTRRANHFGLSEMKVKPSKQKHFA